MTSVLGFLNYNTEGCVPNMIYNFNNRFASNYYDKLVQEFGEPTILADKPDGIAIWKGPDFFEEIILRDEGIEHLEIPSYRSHCDFLYSTIYVYIPEESINTVLNLCQSLVYDRIKKELTNRCYFMGANVAVLWLAMKLIENPQHFMAIKMEYDKAIQASKDGYNYRKMYDELKQMVRDNQSKYYTLLQNRKCVFSS